VTLLAAREVAALDPVAYVRRIPPFDALPDALFLEVAPALEIAVHEAGARLATRSGAPLRYLFVVRRGVVRLEREGQLLQVVEEGEVFGYTSLISKQASFDVVVEERLLAYLLPAASFERLLSDARFAAHFAAGLTERLKASLDAWRVARFEPDVGVPVERLVRRPPVWAEPDVTVRDVARAMRDEHVASVLLRGDPPGIVTARDLRNRVLGEGLGPELPASRVCSRPIRTVPAATPVYEAWRTLLDAGVNHLPVVRDGEILGVVTSTDLLRLSAQSPVAVLRRFERLASRETLPEYAGQVAEMCSALLAAGLDATVIAGFASQLNGVLLRRLLHLAEAELGRPPAPYAWLAFGSEGRGEQTLPTDQDNALVFADEGAAHADWYGALAARVNADLEAAGFPPCPANRMARRWRASRTEWSQALEASLRARPWEVGLYLDMRRIGGGLELDPVGAALAVAGRDRAFLRTLAKHALALRPPSLLALRLRGRARVDLKRHALVPIVSLARCAALEVNSAATGTLARLDDARRAGALFEEAHSSVAEAFRFLLGLRLEVQLRALAAGAPPTDDVALAELTGMQRSRLKDAFHAIEAWQDTAAHRYQASWP
jgi:CBS domain-containing protein